MTSKVLTIEVAETCAAIEAEAFDGLSVTLTVAAVEGVSAARFGAKDEWPGDSLADVHGIVIDSSDGAVFIGTLDDASGFPSVLVSIS